LSQSILVPLLEQHGITVPEPWRLFLNEFDNLRPKMRTIAEPPNDDDIARILNFSFPADTFRILMVVGVNGAGKTGVVKKAEPETTVWGDCSPEFIRTFLETTWKQMPLHEKIRKLDECEIPIEDRVILLGKPHLDHFVPSIFANDDVQSVAHARKNRCRKLWQWAMQVARNRELGGNPHAVVVNLFTNLMATTTNGAMGLGFRGMPDWEFVFLMALLHRNFDFRVVYLNAEVRMAATMGDIEKDLVDVVHLFHEMLPSYFMGMVSNEGEEETFLTKVDEYMPSWLRFIRMP
jgi:hypothetical protein